MHLKLLYKYTLTDEISLNLGAFILLRKHGKAAIPRFSIRIRIRMRIRGRKILIMRTPYSTFDQYPSKVSVFFLPYF